MHINRCDNVSFLNCHKIASKYYCTWCFILHYTHMYTYTHTHTHTHVNLCSAFHNRLSKTFVHLVRDHGFTITSGTSLERTDCIALKSQSTTSKRIAWTLFYLIKYHMVFNFIFWDILHCFLKKSGVSFPSLTDFLQLSLMYPHWLEIQSKMSSRFSRTKPHHKGDCSPKNLTSSIQWIPSSQDL